MSSLMLRTPVSPATADSAALRCGGCLQVLRVARHGAIERNLPVHVFDGDTCCVDERVEAEFCLDCLADILGLSHFPLLFPWWRRRRICRSSASPPGNPAMVKAMVALVILPTAIGMSPAGMRARPRRARQQGQKVMLAVSKRTCWSWRGRSTLP